MTQSMTGTTAKKQDVIRVAFVMGHRDGKSQLQAVVREDPSGKERYRKLVLPDTRPPKGWLISELPDPGEELDVIVLMDTKPLERDRGVLFVGPVPEAKMAYEQATEILLRLIGEFVATNGPVLEYAYIDVNEPGLRGTLLAEVRYGLPSEFGQPIVVWKFSSSDGRQRLWVHPLDRPPVSSAIGYSNRIENWREVVRELGPPMCVEPDEDMGDAVGRMRVTWSRRLVGSITAILTRDVAIAAGLVKLNDIRVVDNAVCGTLVAADGFWVEPNFVIVGGERAGEFIHPLVMHLPFDKIESDDTRREIIRLGRTLIRTSVEHAFQRDIDYLSGSTYARTLAEEGDAIYAQVSQLFPAVDNMRKAMKRMRELCRLALGVVRSSHVLQREPHDPSVAPFYEGYIFPDGIALATALHTERAEVMQRIRDYTAEIMRMCLESIRRRTSPDLGTHVAHAIERLERRVVAYRVFAAEIKALPQVRYVVSQSLDIATAGVERLLAAAVRWYVDGCLESAIGCAQRLETMLDRSEQMLRLEHRIATYSTADT